MINNKFSPLTVFNKVLNFGFRSGRDTFSYPVRIENNNEEILNEILRDSDNLQDKIKVF